MVMMTSKRRAVVAPTRAIIHIPCRCASVCTQEFKIFFGAGGWGPRPEGRGRHSSTPNGQYSPSLDPPSAHAFNPTFRHGANRREILAAVPLDHSFGIINLCTADCVPQTINAFALRNRNKKRVAYPHFRPRVTRRPTSADRSRDRNIFVYFNCHLKNLYRRGCQGIIPLCKCLHTGI